VRCVRRAQAPSPCRGQPPARPRGIPEAGAWSWAGRPRPRGGLEAARGSPAALPLWSLVTAQRPSAGCCCGSWKQSGKDTRCGAEFAAADGAASLGTWKRSTPVPRTAVRPSQAPSYTQHVPGTRVRVCVCVYSTSKPESRYNNVSNICCRPLLCLLVQLYVQILGR
jgi:hypothetical protein